MKNLNLNAYGVQEMNVAEMQETDGGKWAAIATLTLGNMFCPVLTSAVSLLVVTSEKLG